MGVFEKKYKKLGTNMLWMVIGNFSSKILVFLLVPLYTYALSTREYGIADLLTTTISLLIPFFRYSLQKGYCVLH